MKEIIEKLTENNETISTMESCTGGYISSSITNCEGSSEVFNFGAVTYSNAFKIKMGVDKDIISKYSVYSVECANEMAKKISMYTNSTYGIGVTGKLNRVDRFNENGEDNEVFVAIYNSKNNTFSNIDIKVDKETRIENKLVILEKIEERLKFVL